MPRLAIVLWIANVLADTAGRLAFKVAAHNGEQNSQRQRWRRMLGSPPLWGGIVCFAIEFALWLALLSLIPLSLAILLTSINVVAVAIAGRIAFRERLSGVRVAGITLIAVGVALAGGFA
ncbi:MAG: EamA family transporter [Acidobacteriota bacterium]